MTVGEYLGRTTRRQHLAFLEWLKGRWNEPDRGDHYLMLLASLLVRCGQGPVPDINKFKIPFTHGEQTKNGEWMPFPPATKEQADKVNALMAQRRIKDARRGGA